MEKTRKHTSSDVSSFECAHMISEFSKILQNMGNDLENSVGLFDAIGEKNDVFRRIENALQAPSIEPIVKMHNISQNEIHGFVLSNFVKSFSKNKDFFNFIHVARNSNSDLIFFISTKKPEHQEMLESTEFEYATGDLSKFLKVSFCFLESDMEKDLSNTNKINLDA